MTLSRKKKPLADFAKFVKQDALTPLLPVHFMILQDDTEEVNRQSTALRASICRCFTKSTLGR